MASVPSMVPPATGSIPPEDTPILRTGIHASFAAFLSFTYPVVVSNHD
jgi:hypothetical protein